MLKLYSYFRSSAAYRCRIALNLKGLAHETAFVHLIKDGGQHNAPAYRALNPQALLPTLEHDGRSSRSRLPSSNTSTRSNPSRRCCRAMREQRARISAFALAIACDIHPLNNLRVLNYLKGPLGHDQAAADTWYRHWSEEGLEACEALLPAAAKPLLLRRPAHAGRCLPRAAALQRAPLQV